MAPHSPVWTLSAEQVYETLSTSAQGLLETETPLRSKHYGFNELPEPARPQPISLMLKLTVLEMNPLIAPELSTFTPLTLTTLEDCSEESIYAPGYIQPHGVLLVLQEPHLKIVQASENVEQFFGISAATLLGQNLQCLFSRPQLKRMANLLLQDHLERSNPFELKARRMASLSEAENLRGKALTFRSTLHRTTNELILELEPQPPIGKTHTIQFYGHLQAAILSLRKASSLAALAETLAREVKAITGFDRVMVYRFEAAEHGVVVAEVKESHLESFLGLHYPATDIPMPARRLFLRNWVRQIPNINYIPARLLAIQDDPNAQPLDLSDCMLRGVSPNHVEYLQNMGVAGSLTISLIDDQRLWGLIACHHYSPKLVDYETRKTCEFLGQFASIELLHQQERELNIYRAQVKTIQDTMQREFLHDPSFIQQVLTRNATQLLDLVHAEGIAIVLDQSTSLIGRTPPIKDVRALLTWLPQLNQPEIYLTDCLAQSYLPAREFKGTASGVLAIAIVLHQKSYYLLWFRPEQIQTVNWAGDPRTSISVDPDGAKYLTPRKSFELWQEIVQETSFPWQALEREAAQMMRNTLMLAVLEFSQAALEQAAERAAIANRAKSQFLAKMSHELRTPLNAILGFTQVMSHSPNAPTEFREHLGIVSRSGEYLLALINDVLEMSSIEAGQLILTERTFNLHRLLQSLQEMFALKALQNGLVLSFEKDESVPRYVCSDEAKLRQILLNLISNAIKFTTEGSVTVKITAESTRTMKQGRSDSDPSMLCYTLILLVAVTDTGCGIDYHDWEAVFEAFVQTEQGRQAQGTGLGLSISRQFARLMGGDITIQSSVNQGSAFICKVLLQQPESVVEELETTYLVIGLQPGQPTYRILVVEDVLENQQLLRTLLEPIGFEVHIVENGVEAIAQWQQWQPHLILMDIQMPVMDGYAATQQIRLEEQSVNFAEVKPQNQPTTKIVALTAYAFEEDRTASLQAGCDDYMAKPFTEAALFDVIARHLDVQYRYANKVASEPATSVRKPLMPQDLNRMSRSWITQVYEAALDLNDKDLRQLIAQIPQHEQTLIEGMNFLVDNFQLEAIAALTLT
ncbi:MAG TPA: ATP-binding protein [Coleofasciculaceae cyanobacterium]|jgi:light-regulated signal transduction histidine kinase (bacteriophytochrome)/DNA-binding response OmpR family regulator